MDRLVDRLRLPPIDLRKPRNYNYFYGAAEVASKYCRLRDVPGQVRGFWQHGWSPRSWQFDPLALLHVDSTNPKFWPFWVARQDEVDYLRGQGVQQVEAIGLPIAYLPKTRQRRYGNSLLVMPVHSLEYTKHQFAFEEYAEAIESIRSKFDHVVVCIHPSCLAHGYWASEFRSRGFEIVEGVGLRDRNGLLRVQALMSAFEFVTTNGMGSHIAYAAALGAKASIFGPFANFRAEDFVGDPFYVKHPHLLDPIIDSMSEAAMRRDWPWLFCHPQKACPQTAWAQRELGFDCRRLPAELSQSFAWPAPPPNLWQKINAKVRSFPKVRRLPRAA